MLRPPLLPFNLLPLAAIAFIGLAACSGQGEGELCNPLAGHNGSDDCQDGLVCVTSRNYSSGRCCPQPGQQATAAVCSTNNGGLGGSPAPSDTPSADASTQEANADAAVESAAEAATETDGPDGATE